MEEKFNKKEKKGTDNQKASKKKKGNKAGYTGQDGAPGVVNSQTYPKLYKTYPKLY